MTKKGSWAEFYRPTTIEDTILPEKIKERFKKYVESGELPNLILHGPSGTGKTTIAKAALAELGADVLFINGSLKNGIDVLRYEISSFASTMSFSGGKKYVIIDEADWISSGTQAGFRSFIDEYEKNCGFILTLNYPNRIMPELHSRFSEIDFNFDNDDRSKLASQYLKRLMNILNDNNVGYDKKVLAKLIVDFFPDFRKVLNEVQAYAISSDIDEGIFKKKLDTENLFTHLKNKDFDSMRKWVSENSEKDMLQIYKDIYDKADKYVEKKSIPALVVLLGEYQYKHKFVADIEINIAAMLTEIMHEVVIK